MHTAIILISAFLVGSFPTGWIVHRAVQGTDIRTFGSGSTGATNTFRQLGWKWSILVLLIDFLKGYLTFIVAIHYLPEKWILFDREMLAAGSGLCAMLGHIFPPWLGFRGGKGVATGAGFLVALFPPALPIGLGIFIVVVALSRKVSLASLSAAISVSLGYLLFALVDSRNTSLPRTIVFSLIPLLIIITHRKNILRLISGKERTIM